MVLVAQTLRIRRSHQLVFSLCPTVLFRLFKPFAVLTLFELPRMRRDAYLDNDIGSLARITICLKNFGLIFWGDPTLYGDTSRSHPAK